MRKNLFITAAILILTASVSTAAFLPLPDLTPVQTGSVVAGQSTWVGSLGGDFINVDWMVFQCGNFAANLGCNSSEDYAYLYQIENDSSAVSGQTGFSVTYDNLLGTDAYFAGYLPNFDDLDAANGFHPGHTFPTFPNLAAETEPAGVIPTDVSGPLAGNTVGGTSWDWGFSAVVGPTLESSTMYMLSTRPPHYGQGNAKDSVPPSPWASFPNGQRVPVPGVPEPGTVFLLGLGLSGLRLRSRRNEK